jgi:hypothetical protein
MELKSLPQRHRGTESQIFIRVASTLCVSVPLWQITVCSPVLHLCRPELTNPATLSHRDIENCTFFSMVNSLCVSVPLWQFLA